MKSFVYNWSGFITIAWALVIFALCSVPGQYIPSNTFLELLSFDKLIHAFIFFILYLTGYLFIKRKNINTFFILIYLVTCVFYGISLEYMQATFFINRSFDYYDMIANSFGVLAAYLLRERIFGLFRTENN
ncbi:MAG: VanZ family protein [Bacteroidia bacterium]